MTVHPFPPEYWHNYLIPKKPSDEDFIADQLEDESTTIYDLLQTLIATVGAGALPSDVPYDEGSWNGDLAGATKNVLRDKFESITDGQVFSGAVQAPNLIASGLTGATFQPAILAGGTNAGPPASGTHVAGEIILDATGSLWYCTVGGTPGTWIDKLTNTFESLPDLVAIYPVLLDTATDPTEARYGVDDIWARRLFNPVPAAAVSGTITATSVLASTYQIPANTLKVGDVLEITSWGNTGNDVGADATITLRLKWAAANLWSTGAITLPDAGLAQYPWVCKIIIRLDEASGGTLDPTGTVIIGGAAGAVPVIVNKIVQGTLTVYDPATLSSAIDFTVAHSSASASMITNGQGFTIRRIPV